MREIKFRGKTVNEGQWIESMTISRGSIKRKMNEMFMEVGPDKWKGVIPETVGQFTGLKDKNGKEIYENDIVRWIDSDSNERIDTVLWKKGGLVLCNSMYTVGEYLTFDLEVIGNLTDDLEEVNRIKNR